MTFEEIFQKAVKEHTKESRIQVIDMCIILIETYKFSPEEVLCRLLRLRGEIKVNPRYSNDILSKTKLEELRKIYDE